MIHEPSHEMARGGICGRPDGHRGQHLSPEAVEHNLESARARYSAAPDQVRKQAARSRALQLMRGDRIQHPPPHHEGMAKLKEFLGDSRPEGLELSLIREDSPYVYVVDWHERLYLLSTEPDDYAWESRVENMARSRRTQQ